VRAEILCIGTELLLGDVINTNAAFLGKELSGIGIDLYFTTVVGDNRERIIDSLSTAFQRADIIITSGGIGPTEDDLTHECIAKFLGVEQDYHQDIADRLTSWFTARGREMVKSNLKQAYLPHDTDVLPNQYGTAPGLIYNKNNKIILTFPGVPTELKDMWNSTARDYLQKLNPLKAVIKSRILRFVGESESTLAEKVSDFLNNSNPTVAPLAGKGEVVLRVTAKAEDELSAKALIAPVEKEIISRFEKFYYGADEDTLTSVTLKLLQEKNATLAIAETFTGGLIAERLLSHQGADQFMILGIISAGQLINSQIPGTESFGTVSENAVAEMAEKIRDLAGTKWGIAATGCVEQDNELFGTIYVAVASSRKTVVRSLNYAGWKRENIIYIGSQAALNLLRLCILGKE
jgi:nicotinamide-nucleotide amidase